MKPSTNIPPETLALYMKMQNAAKALVVVCHNCRHVHAATICPICKEPRK